MIADPRPGTAPCEEGLKQLGSWKLARAIRFSGVRTLSAKRHALSNELSADLSGPGKEDSRAKSGGVEVFERLRARTLVAAGCLFGIAKKALNKMKTSFSHREPPKILQGTRLAAEGLIYG